MKDEFMYPESESRTAPHMAHLWVLVMATAIHAIFTRIWPLLGTDVSGTMVSMFAFVLAVFVGAYMSMATNRYIKGLDAITSMTATIDSIGLLVRQVDDQEKKTACSKEMVFFLRAMYADLRGWSEEKREEHSVLTYSEALVRVSDAIQDAGLTGALVGGNGTFNRLLLARATAKTTTSVPLSHGAKWAAWSTFPISALIFAIFLPGSGLSWWLQAPAFGSFCYGVILMIVVAEDVSNPFGVGRSKVALRDRFLTWETRLAELVKETKALSA